MASTITEVVYLTRDNTVDLVLKADGVVTDLTDVTKIEVMDLGCSWAINSEDTPEAFDIGTTDGKVVLKFGQEAIHAGTYRCHVIVYDVTNVDGVVWGEIKLVFKLICPPSPTP